MNNRKDGDLLQYEQKILNRVIDRMDQVLDNLDGKAKEYVKEGKKARAAGAYENYFALLLAEKGLKDTKENRQKLLQARDELYDSRLELILDDDKDITEVLVGDHSFLNKDEVLVFNRNRPICRPFWGGQVPEKFEFDNYDENGRFIAHVRGKLKLSRNINLHFTKVKDVMHLFPLTKEEQEELIVDILTQELLERRKDNEWRSILRSIQKKQKEIVLSPLKNNLIVQGCAGSGKTMIMLQRLPIVLMDNPLILQKNNIYIITPSKTYIQLAKNMTEQLEIADLKMGILRDYYDYAISKYIQNEESYGEIDLTVKLDYEDEKYIYSDVCIYDIKKYIRGLLERYELDLFNEYQELNIPYPKEDKNIYAMKIQAELLKQQKIINANNDALRGIYRQFKFVYNNLVTFDEVLKNRVTTIERTIRRKITEQKEIIAIAEKELLKLDEQQNEVAWKNRQIKIENANKYINAYLQELQELSEDTEYAKTIESVEKSLSDIIEENDVLNNEFEKAPTRDVYDVIGGLEVILRKYGLISEKIKMCSDKYDIYVESIEVKYRKCGELLNNLLQIEKRYLRYEKYDKLIHHADEFLKKTKSIMSDMHKYVLEKVKLKADEKGNIKAIKASPYLYAQMLYQYYGVPNGAKETLITIDEAQGLAVEEIRLIHNLNSNKVIFNLFGDVNQHIENTKGIDDWDELDTIADFKLESMKENYRNASQITDYCNNKFENLNMRPMNTAGKGVHQYEEESEFIEKIIKQFVDVNRIKQSAIIVKDLVEAEYIKDKFSKFINKIEDLTGEEYSTHRTKWNLMTIDNAKGLEFNTVIALSGRMTNNEKYIAYTRALDELFVYDGDLDLIVYEEKLKRLIEEEEKNKLEKKKTEKSEKKAKEQKKKNRHRQQ